MTTSEWFNNSNNVSELKTLLNNEVLKRAFEVLIYNKLPVPTQLPEQEVMQHMTVINARREGYYTFYRDLQALASVPKTKPGLPKPWEGHHVNSAESE